VEIHEKTLIVKEPHLDELNHVNNVQYVQWVQDVAEEHWLKNASSDILSQYFWVLISHHIEYKNQARLGDPIKLKTFIVKNEGVKSVRRVEISNLKTDQLLALSDTTWCLINAKTHKPSRVTKEIIRLFD